MAWNLIHMSDSEAIQSIVVDDKILQGITPISFSINLTDLSAQEQQYLVVDKNSIRPKFILNGDSMIVDIFSSATIIRQFFTHPQFVHLENSQSYNNWNNKFADKLYQRSIDTKVSISVASAIIFLLLLYHVQNYIRLSRIPK
eukprot:NODE_298_length_10484_cov_0.802600.p9 type:complete len:143 gc:universal NODE_298_length_10484_cov_0.802600:1252-824(-)